LGDRVRQAGGRVRREDLPPPGKRPDLVRRQAERRGIRLDPQAARYLAEYLGDEIGNLSGVLEQLGAIHGDGARLGEADVASLFQGARHGFQWDITDALDRGDAAAALEYVHGELEKWPAQPVLAALVTHYRRIVTVAGRNLTPGQAAAELGVKEFPAKKVVEQARRLGIDGARQAYQLLATADVHLRGGGLGLDPTTVLDVLVVQLAGLVNGTGRSV
jgi:DNA polymerase III delta subunit